uniref:Uncharacterized protein n=1 Tax=Arundo donax TaxID=35708 RepID=A0A0A8XY29_ARUDO
MRNSQATAWGRKKKEEKKEKREGRERRSWPSPPAGPFTLPHDYIGFLDSAAARPLSLSLSLSLSAAAGHLLPPSLFLQLRHCCPQLLQSSSLLLLCTALSDRSLSLLPPRSRPHLSHWRRS